MLALGGCTRLYCLRVGGTSEHPEFEDHWICGPADESWFKEVRFGDKLKKKTDGLGRVRLTYLPLASMTPWVKDVSREYNDGSPIQ